jgi:hypothetical protein
MGKCALEHSETGCCCTCKHRLRALSHDSFPSSEQIGWACIGFAFMEGEDIAYIGDFEHGLCELYAKRVVP